MTWGWVRWLVKFFLVLTSWKDFRRGKFWVWKKIFWFFGVSFVTEIGRSNPWQNPYIIRWKNQRFEQKKFVFLFNFFFMDGMRTLSVEGREKISFLWFLSFRKTFLHRSTNTLHGIGILFFLGLKEDTIVKEFGKDLG